MEKGAKGSVACLMVGCKKPLAVVVAALVLLLIALMETSCAKDPEKAEIQVPSYQLIEVKANSITDGTVKLEANPHQDDSFYVVIDNKYVGKINFINNGSVVKNGLPKVELFIEKKSASEEVFCRIASAVMMATDSLMSQSKAEELLKKANDEASASHSNDGHASCDGVDYLVKSTSDHFILRFEVPAED